MTATKSWLHPLLLVLLGTVLAAGGAFAQDAGAGTKANGAAVPPAVPAVKAPSAQTPKEPPNAPSPSTLEASLYERQDGALLLAMLIGVGLPFTPVITYVSWGWAVRRDQIFDGLSDKARECYLKMFSLSSYGRADSASAKKKAKRQARAACSNSTTTHGMAADTSFFPSCCC